MTIDRLEPNGPGIEWIRDALTLDRIEGNDYIYKLNFTFRLWKGKEHEALAVSSLMVLIEAKDLGPKGVQIDDGYEIPNGKGSIEINTAIHCDPNRKPIIKSSSKLDGLYLTLIVRGPENRELVSKRTKIGVKG